MSLTTIRDLDYLILNVLSDCDLINLRLVNRYFRDILSPNNSSYWLSRVRIFLGKEYSSSPLPNNLSWYQWYFYWRKHPYDIISQELKLTPQQAYIRQSSEKGIVIGTENYQAINLTLIKAFKSRDKNLIQYFFRLYRQIKEKSFDQQHKSVDYGKVISSALKQGYEDEAKELLDDFIADHTKLEICMGKKEVRKYTYTIAKALGRSNLIRVMDYLETKITTRIKAKYYYCYGLIKGYHNKEAKEYLDKLVITSSPALAEYLITEAYSYAYRSGNIAFTTYLNEKYPTISFSEEICGRYVDEIHKDDELETIITLMKDCPEELYLERFIEIFNYGRYDALKSLLSYFEAGHFDDWYSLIFSTVISPYKDMLLFLLIRFYKNYPTCFEENLKMISQYVPMAYPLELKYLHDNICKIKGVEAFLSLDYHHLLVTSLKEAFAT
jgi:hypothetical protein